MGPETGLNLPAQRAIQKPNGNFKQTVILRLILRVCSPLTLNFFDSAFTETGLVRLDWERLFLF